MQTINLELTKSIWQVLAYHDIFRYPLTAVEIQCFLNQYTDREQLVTALGEMVAAGQVYCIDGYFCLHNDPSLALRRTEGNTRAAQLLPIGFRVGRVLGKFPFVRGVGISGSLSKNFADKDADIDFFIITGANRMWLARTLLHCLKKLSFLAGKQHWFCMNYFIDEEALLMPEQNLFVAIEVVTLKPVSGMSLDDFFRTNDWAMEYFPNHNASVASTHISLGNAWYKTVAEWCLKGKIGDWLDDRLMQITKRRWLKKEQARRLNSKGFPLSLCVGKHYGRPNPAHLQQKILSLLEEKMRSMPASQTTLADIVSIPAHFLRREII